MKRDYIYLDDYIGRIGEKYTFAGVLSKFYCELFARCNKETQSSYNRIYNTYILPLLKDKPIEELTLEDYEAVINAISRKKVLEHATLMRYRYLIRTVVRLAVQQNICQDVLFGSIFSIPEKDDKGNEKQFVKNKKSLTILEELNLYEKIMTDPQQDGGKMGLALMYSMGFRNSEACAMKYSSIRPLDSHPSTYCIWMFVSTIGRTNKTKSGGKTPNAPRKVPIPSAMLELLWKRKQYIQHLINIGALVLSDGQTVDDLPIVCKNDFVTNYSSEELSAVGRAVLREIKVEEDILSYIDRDLQEPNILHEMGVVDKDPTAYLLRRNFATHLNILRLTEAEIEYIMGHHIDDKYAHRDEYSSDERLVMIAEKMKHRPILNDSFQIAKTATLSSENFNFSSCDTTALTLRAKNTPGCILCVQAGVLEPSDTINVSITSETSETVPAKYFLLPKTQESSRTVNVLPTYHASYVNAKKRHK